MPSHILRVSPSLSVRKQQLRWRGDSHAYKYRLWPADGTGLRSPAVVRNGFRCNSISTRGRSKAARFQVEHQTFIPVGREQFWRLLKELTPPHKWEALAPAFACLESIYRVEYNLVVEEALKAYRDANNATIPNPAAASQEPPSPPVHQHTDSKPRVTADNKFNESGSDTMNGAAAAPPSKQSRAAAVPSSEQSRSKPNGSTAQNTPTKPAQTDKFLGIPVAAISSAGGSRDGTGTALQIPVLSTLTAEGGKGSEEPSLEEQLIMTGQQVEQELQQAGQELVETIKTLDRMAQEASQQQAEWETAKKLQEAAEKEAAEKLWQLDRKFMELVWYLSVRAHFAPLGLRDILLSRSLNSDYLWQLFIKAGPYRLDSSLVTTLVNPHEQTGEPTAAGGRNGEVANGVGPGTDDNRGSNGAASNNGTPSTNADDSKVKSKDDGGLLKGLGNAVSNGTLWPKPEGTNSWEGKPESSRAVVPPWEEELTFLRNSPNPLALPSNSITTSSLRSINNDSSNIRLSSLSSMSLQSWSALRRDWAELPEEAQRVLVLKRAYGQDVQSGRLIIQKLDYLQLLLVRSLWKGVKDTTMVLADDVRQFWSRRGELVAGGQSRAASSDGEEGTSNANTADSLDGDIHANGAFSERASEGGSQEAWPDGGGWIERARASIQGWVNVPGIGAGQSGGANNSSVQGTTRGAGGEDAMSDAGDRNTSKAKSITRKATAAPIRTTSARSKRPRRGPVLQRLYNWVRIAGGAAVNVLVDWGLLPQFDVPTLAQVNSRFPVKQERGKPASYLEKQSLEELFGGWDGFWGPEGPVRTFLSKVEVLEPTYKEMLVLYRNRPKRSRLRTWIPVWIPFMRPPALVDGPIKRPPITLRIYHDIPMPTWKVVYPDKLLQFRPLDLIRLDLFAFAGIGAAMAQARYDSIILDFVTLTTFTVLAIRVTLGYKRMVDRYENSVNELLREKTVAGNEGAVEYLGSSASLQQFKQAALAYALLAADDTRPLDADEVANRAEKVIVEACGQQVRFDVQEALAELKRLGLLHLCGPGEAAAEAINGTGVLSGSQNPFYPSHLVISDPSTVQFIVKGHWERLLWQRVDKVLQSVDKDMEV